MNRYTLSEWERAGVPNRIATQDADALLSLASRSALCDRYGCGVLDAVAGGVLTRNVVGLLQTPSASLEILPKINATSGVVRNRLVEMLHVVMGLDPDTLGSGDLGLSRLPLLEQLSRLFANCVRKALRRGLPRRYVDQAADLSCVRGRLDLARQYSLLLARPSQLACRYSELSADQPLNRIVKTTLELLLRQAGMPGTRRELTALLSQYESVTSLPASIARSLPCQTDRLDSHWYPILRYARHLLSGSSQTTSRGRERGYTLLFTMHDLFERYLAELTRRAMQPLGWQVMAQAAGVPYGTDLGSGRAMPTTRPDLNLETPSGRTVIIDTKWKDIGPGTRDSQTGVASSDIYQMIAYADLHAADPVILLYPNHPSDAACRIVRRYGLNTQGSPTLILARVDVSRPPHEIISSLGSVLAESLWDV